MENTNCCTSELKEKIADNALEQKKLHDITTMAASLKRILVRHGDVLKEEGVRKEMQRLEEWLEAERKGHAPVCVISQGGISWLSILRDRLKFSVDEAIRLEGEGGNPSTKDQIEKTEDLLKTIRRIDAIIDDSSVAQPH